ncbi:MAG: hypothetical protein COZ18_04275 [Flexibacter sp. CG_4_10_14_3_um_filter_32_15]|nr:MAG: hypothetical protein COZ18_04275 [Flexibacter sp. CG_4_10_14_3_um_filter_32_15]
MKTYFFLNYFFSFGIMSLFCFACGSETQKDTDQETEIADFSPALHFEQLEKQNREAADSLEALYDMHYRALEGDSTMKRKGNLLRQRTETILQHIDKTYYDLAKFLDNIPADKNYKEATILFFIGKNKKGRGYKLEESLKEYVTEINKIDESWDFTSPFVSQNDVELLHDKNTDSVEAHFQKTFPEAAFAFLSALKKEVILIELQAIDELAKRNR